MKAYNGSLVDTYPATQGQGLPNLRLYLIQDSSSTRRYDMAYQIEPPSRLRLIIGTIANSTICEISTEYVQAQIRCSRAADNADLACFVESMRHNPDLLGFGNLTALDIGGNRELLEYIPYTGASSHAREASILEKWLMDPPAALDTSQKLDAGANGPGFMNVSREVFAGRFAMALNTHLRATLDTSYTVGSDGLALKNETQSWARTNGTWTEYTAPTYHLNRSWFLLYLLSAIVLAICALANIILRTIIYVPDFLGSVSAMTRDSKYIQVRSPGSTLDGTERSRLLRYKRVMVQDVQPDEVIGRIALSDDPDFIAVRKERQYV
jgi:hypothetical protein